MDPEEKLGREGKETAVGMYYERRMDKKGKICGRIFVLATFYHVQIQAAFFPYGISKNKSNTNELKGLNKASVVFCYWRLEKFDVGAQQLVLHIL